MKKLILIGILLTSAFAVYSQDAAVTTANTVLRQTPARSGRAIRKLELNSIVHVIRHKGSWTYIKANKSVGWVPGNSVSPVREAVVGGVSNDAEGSTYSANSSPVPPKPPPPTPKTISGGVVSGKATTLVKPTYPAAARAGKASGSVVVQVLLDENGKVVSANAISGHPLLRAAAESAARASTFSPTLLKGEPVKVSGVVTYNFVP